MSKVIWDKPTRLFHWFIAIPVLCNFILEGGEKPHRFLGYVAFGGVIARIIWGLLAKNESSFFRFPLRPHQVMAYIKCLKTKNSTPYIGHNPLASWAYLFIWLLVLTLGVTGYMMGLDAYWGVEWLENLHGLLSKTLMGFVFLHFIGIIFDSFKFKRKTWLAMINGKK
ncbi:MAG: cytochrome b/b6 domain-containing protein [Bacteriovoracaceae bacterium]